VAKHIVTFAPPTPNGGLHIGHLSGPYLAADVYARSQRLLGDEVAFVSYSDDYQSYLSRKARELDRSVETLAKDNYLEIKAALENCRIVPDCFATAHGNERFLKTVDWFKRIASKHCEMQVDHVPYCEHCNLWGFEANARGECSQCQASTDRSQCESCAAAPEVTGVSTVTCIQCRRLTKLVPVEREYLRLHEFREVHEALVDRSGIRDPLIAYLDRILGLSRIDWPVDRPQECGIPCPSAANGTVSTWFAGVAGYYAATEEIGKDDYWHDPAVHCAFFVGFDCSFSHAVVYPSLLKSAKLPAYNNLRIYTNSFLKLRGEDFSTSRGVAIWANDLLSCVDADYVRFYLALAAPELTTSNFEPLEFCEYIRNDLISSLSSLISTCRSLPDGQPLSSVHADQWRSQWREATAVDRFSMKRLAGLMDRALKELVVLAEGRSSLDATRLFAAWAALASPLLPEFSSSFLSALGMNLDDYRAWVHGRTHTLPEPSQLLSDGFSLAPFDMKPSELVRLIQGIRPDAA